MSQLKKVIFNLKKRTQMLKQQLNYKKNKNFTKILLAKSL